MPPPPINLKIAKYKISFLLNKFFNLENLGANLFSIASLKKNPAKIYNVKNKGFLKIGYDADIAIVDMQLEKILSGSKMQAKCGWTAFEGQKIKGSPIITIVNGNIVYKDGKIIDDFKGKPVNFNE